MLFSKDTTLCVALRQERNENKTTRYFRHWSSAEHNAVHNAVSLENITARRRGVTDYTTDLNHTVSSTVLCYTGVWDSCTRNISNMFINIEK